MTLFASLKQFLEFFFTFSWKRCYFFLLPPYLKLFLNITILSTHLHQTVFHVKNKTFSQVSLVDFTLVGCLFFITTLSLNISEKFCLSSNNFD